MTNSQGTNEHGGRSMSSALATAAASSSLAEDVVDAAIELHTEYAGLAAACLARAVHGSIRPRLA